MHENREELKEEEILFWMSQALKQAEKGASSDEIPVGCVFIRFNNNRYQKVVGSHNLTNLYKNASRHCQINCLNEMEKTLSKDEIAQCILFVTVQPCIMCTFALNLMGIKKAYFGQFNDKFGGCGSLRKDNFFQVKGGIMQKESLQIIKAFYQRGNQKIPQEMRNRGRKKIKNDK